MSPSSRQFFLQKNHITRVKRKILAEFSQIPLISAEKIVWYPADKRKTPKFTHTRIEIRKIPDYIKKGILPAEDENEN